MVLSQLGNQDRSRCFLHCQYEERAALTVETSPTTPSPHTNICTLSKRFPYSWSNDATQKSLVSHRVTHNLLSPMCKALSILAYSCWNCCFTRLTQLEQALSPQIACKGSSKISQQKTHEKFCACGPDWARHGGVKRLEFKNSDFSATSVITEQVSSALTACSVRHLG